MIEPSYVHAAYFIIVRLHIPIVEQKIKNLPRFPTAASAHYFDSFPMLSRFVRTLATHASSANALATRHTWAKQEIQQIYDIPLLDLVFRAAAVHRQYHDPSKVQLCTLMNIKSSLIIT